jgi:hypothetical protein
VSKKAHAGVLIRAALPDFRRTGAPDGVYLENKTRVFFIDSEAEVNGTAEPSTCSPRWH